MQTRRFKKERLDADEHPARENGYLRTLTYCWLTGVDVPLAPLL